MSCASVRKGSVIVAFMGEPAQLDQVIELVTTGEGISVSEYNLSGGEAIGPVQAPQKQEKLTEAPPKPTTPFVETGGFVALIIILVIIVVVVGVIVWKSCQSANKAKNPKRKSSKYDAVSSDAVPLRDVNARGSSKLMIPELEQESAFDDSDSFTPKALDGDGDGDGDGDVDVDV